MMIGLDIDGVLADFITPFLQMLEQRTGNGSIDPASVTDPNFMQHPFLTKEIVLECMEAVSYDPEFWRTLAPLPTPEQWQALDRIAGDHAIEHALLVRDPQLLVRHRHDQRCRRRGHRLLRVHPETVGREGEDGLHRLVPRRGAQVRPEGDGDPRGDDPASVREREVRREARPREEDADDARVRDRPEARLGGVEEVVRGDRADLRGEGRAPRVGELVRVDLPVEAVGLRGREDMFRFCQR